MTLTFDRLNLNPILLRAVLEKGYTAPTPIQAQAIPPAMEGKDVLGCAQTGTGKTAAFALPILHRLWKAEHPRGPRPVLALVLAPTRELASQIGESFAAYGKHSGLKTTVIFGGVGYDKQRKALTQGVDIVVATPGRLLDLIKERAARFDGLRVLVLDEADRMLDMGFLPDVKRVLAALPRQKQTMCFSATMPPEIQRLVDGILHTPVKVAVAPVATTAEKVEQAVYFVDKNQKAELLIRLLKQPEVTRALVFTRTKRGANKLATRLESAGIRAEAIHGNKSQNARERALASFKSGKQSVLVATDIAARGIDVTGISHVVNFELPNEPETYVHRIGRTARASATGVAWSLCGGEEREFLRDIERLIRQKVPVAQGSSAPAHGGGRGHAPQSDARPSTQRAHAEPRERTSHTRPAAAAKQSNFAAPVAFAHPAAAAASSNFGAGVDHGETATRSRDAHARPAAHAPAREERGGRDYRRSGGPRNPVPGAHGRDARHAPAAGPAAGLPPAPAPFGSGAPRGAHGPSAPRGAHGFGSPRGGHGTGAPRGAHGTGAPRGAHGSGAPRSAHPGAAPSRSGHGPAGRDQGRRQSGERQSGPRHGASGHGPRGGPPKSARGGASDRRR